jgi:hypothetical protein
LRHERNVSGGFTGGSRAAGTDRLRTNTFGGRLTGALAHGLKYSLEGAAQTGKVGAATHRGTAWASSLSRRWTVAGMPLAVLGEYKYASGTKNPKDLSRVSAFDQLYPSQHDKFGHLDLFGWRNIHNARSLVTLGLTQAMGVTAGRHVGQETDIFAAYGLRWFTFGAGYGYLWTGEFLRKATPGVAPSYAYVFSTFAFQPLPPPKRTIGAYPEEGCTSGSRPPCSCRQFMRTQAILRLESWRLGGRPRDPCGTMKLPIP